MSVSQFFGDLSPFEIIVAIVAFSTGVYTLYKSVLEGAKFAAYPGDRLSLVISAGGGCRKFQLRANLANKAVKTGTLHRLEADVTPPGTAAERYQWRIFFEYTAGAQAVQAKADAHPVSLPGKSSEPLFVEFELADPTHHPTWQPGRYEIKLIGWVNKEHRSKPPNLESVFHIMVTDALSQRLQSRQPKQPNFEHVAIEEWAIQH